MPAYHLKMTRARGHLANLTAEIQRFMASKPYEIYVEENPDSEGQFLWKVRVKAVVPEDWSAIIGDAIHNARSALDLLAVAVVRRCDPNRQSYNHARFPFGKSRAIFETNLREALRGTNRAARDVFAGVKPYKGGNEMLWRIHALDVLDKHKAIIPVGAAYSFVRLPIDMKKDFPELEWMQKAPAFTMDLKPADRLYPLQDGETLYAAPKPSGSMGEPSFGFDVAFGEGEIADGELLIPTLEEMMAEVDRVIEQVEARILTP